MVKLQRKYANFRQVAQKALNYITGGGKLYKKVAQNLLAVLTCAAMVLLNAPLTTLAMCEHTTLIAVSAEPATCTSEGLKAHWKCKEAACGAVFEDARGEKEIAFEDLRTPMLEHDFKDIDLDAYYHTAKKCDACGLECAGDECELTEEGHDRYSHWKNCKCGLSDGIGTAHSFTYERIDEEKHRVKCTVCGYEKEENHDSGDWEVDAEMHWKDCICGEEFVVREKHDFVAKNMGTKEIKVCECGEALINGKRWDDMYAAGELEEINDGETLMLRLGSNFVLAPVSDNRGHALDVVWVKSARDVDGMWFGLDNSKRVFDEESLFWVEWLDKNTEPEAWEKYYNNLDDGHKKAIEGENVRIFLVGVTKLDGTAYTNFGTEVPFYVQLSEGWDKDDINAVFIAVGSDEVLDVSYVEDMVYPEGKGTFAKIMLNHFSPYAVYDKLNEKELEALGASGGKNGTASALKTGDVTSEVVISVLAIILVSSLGIMMVLISNKKKFEEQ